MVRRALVLGAGGPAAIPWEIGLIAGMADAGIDLRNVDLFVGTSAGAVVTALITSGRAAKVLFQQQVNPDRQVDELTPPVDFNQLKADLVELKAESGRAVEILRRIGAVALAASTVSEAERRQVIAARLPMHGRVSRIWDRRLRRGTSRRRRDSS
jgi:NTE family protein